MPKKDYKIKETENPYRNADLSVGLLLRSILCELWEIRKWLMRE